MLKIYTRIVYWLLGLIAIIMLMYSLFTSDGQGRVSSYLPDSHRNRENATFVTLARNSDLEDLMKPIRSIEDRFNNKYHYDWVFLNEEEFSDEFKEMTRNLISGNVRFGVIPKQHWSYPSWIDQQKAADSRKSMAATGIIYGDNEPYRHMCRFESGFFFQHPIMREYKYYWRVEPSTALLCDVDYDVFEFMRMNNKKYGWTISITEFRPTIATLWNTTLEFINQYPNYLAKNSLEGFATLVRDEVEDSNDKNRDTPVDAYNLCHFWSNFEVGDMDFWRGEVYQAYFDHLDKSGGFFYERWGDAPVHSIAAALFLNKDEIHFFEDIGYEHPPFNHCPAVEYQRANGLKCSCFARDSFDWHQSSCLRTYNKAMEIRDI